MVTHESWFSFALPYYIQVTLEVKMVRKYNLVAVALKRSHKFHNLNSAINICAFLTCKVHSYGLIGNSGIFFTYLQSM
jgi:hypothetical protein